MVEKPKKRRFWLQIKDGSLIAGQWFQISLLTAGMLLVVLGLEVHLNSRLSLDAAKSHYERGWPFVMYGYGGEAGIRLTDAELQALRRARGSGLRRRSSYVVVPTVFFWKDRADLAWVSGSCGLEPTERPGAWSEDRNVFWEGEWYVREMLLNIGVAGILLAITAFVFESLIRRREAASHERDAKT